MMKTKIKYVGKHMPKEIIEIESPKAYELINTKNYVLVEQNSLIPNLCWTEKQIKQYIKDHDLNIKYNIVNDTKKDILKKIEDVLND